jgi:hypothetical protein
MHDLMQNNCFFMYKFYTFDVKVANAGFENADTIIEWAETRML